jgi:Bacillus haemolytic enterotoxin (HBL)
MRLAAIVAAPPTQQQLLDYQNSCAEVNRYAYAITNTSLPVLNEPPSNYGDFATEFAPAKAHCLEWTTGIFPTMLAFPQTIVNQSADLFNLEETLAGGYLDALIANPSDEQAKKGLAQALTTMQKLAQAQLSVAQGLVDSMNTFSGNIGTDATTLNTIASQALTAAGADEQSITNLNSDIQSLKDQIDTLNKLLELSEIGIGVSIFIGLIGAVVCLIPGAQAVGVGIIVLAVAGGAASITGTVLLDKDIAAKNDAIQADQQEISNLNQDVVALKAIDTQFAWLETANITALQALKTVVQMWRDLDGELGTAQQELATVGTDATAEKYQQAKADLTEAATAWADVVAFAQALAGVDYRWQDKDGNWHSYTDQQPGTDDATVAQLPSKIAA